MKDITLTVTHARVNKTDNYLYDYDASDSSLLNNSSSSDSTEIGAINSRLRGSTRRLDRLLVNQ